jgi:hypothetical protein
MSRTLILISPAMASSLVGVPVMQQRFGRQPFSVILLLAAHGD